MCLRRLPVNEIQLPCKQIPAAKQLESGTLPPSRSESLASWCTIKSRKAAQTSTQGNGAPSAQLKPVCTPLRLCGVQQVRASAEA